MRFNRHGFEILFVMFYPVKGAAKIFFSNYAPSEVAFSRLSGIDCTQPFFEIRPGLISDLAQMRLYMDRNWNKLEKAYSQSNFKERFGTIHSWEPGEFNLRGHINRKKIRKLFLRFLIGTENIFMVESKIGGLTDQVKRHDESVRSKIQY